MNDAKYIYDMIEIDINSLLILDARQRNFQEAADEDGDKDCACRRIRNRRREVAADQKQIRLKQKAPGEEQSINLG